MVTGAAGGIGHATALAFAAAGYEVVATDMTAGTGVDGARWVAGDLREATVRRGLVDAVGDGGLDALVVAHGVEGSGSVSEISASRARSVMEVNFECVVRLWNGLSAALLATGGSMVVVSSQAGLVAEADNGVYCASKSALVAWLRTIAPRTRVRLRLLCPGVIDTPLLASAFQGMADAQQVDYGEVVERRTAHTPLRRLGRTEEMAGAALWLARLRTPGVLTAAITGGEVLA